MQLSFIIFAGDEILSLQHLLETIWEYQAQMYESGISDPGDFVNRCRLMNTQALEERASLRPTGPASTESTSIYSHTPLAHLPAPAPTQQTESYRMQQSVQQYWSALQLELTPAPVPNPHADWDYEKSLSKLDNKLDILCPTNFHLFEKWQYREMIPSYLLQRRPHLYATPNNSTQFAEMYEPPDPQYQLAQPQQPPPEQVGAPLPAAAPIQNFAMGPQGPEFNFPLGLNQTRHSAPHELDAQLPLTLNQPEQAINETIAHPTSPSPSTPFDRLCKVL